MRGRGWRKRCTGVTRRTGTGKWTNEWNLISLPWPVLRRPKATTTGPCSCWRGRRWNSPPKPVCHSESESGCPHSMPARFPLSISRGSPPTVVPSHGTPCRGLFARVPGWHGGRLPPSRSHKRGQFTAGGGQVNGHAHPG